MNTEEMKRIVEDRVLDLMVKYESAVGDTGKFTPQIPDIIYETVGRTAGWARFNFYLGKGELDFNVELMTENFGEFLKTTVTHEVAHHCVSLLNGRILSKSGRNVSHGRQWKEMMRFFGIDEPKRCHSYDTFNVSSRKLRRFRYTCDCGFEHNLSIIIHNKIRKNKQTRVCNLCDSQIVFSHEIK